MFNSLLRSMEDRIQDYWFLKNRMGDDHGTVTDAMHDIIAMAKSMAEYDREATN